MTAGPHHLNAARSKKNRIIRVPARERELSCALNRLIGEANCEAALLPTRTTIDDWTYAQILDAVIPCQRSVIAVLCCAVALQSLDDLDAYSMIWIDEARQACVIRPGFPGDFSGIPRPNHSACRAQLFVRQRHGSCGDVTASRTSSVTQNARRESFSVDRSS